MTSADQNPDSPENTPAEAKERAIDQELREYYYDHEALADEPNG